MAFANVDIDLLKGRHMAISGQTMGRKRVQAGFVDPATVNHRRFHSGQRKVFQKDVKFDELGNEIERFAPAHHDSEVLLLESLAGKLGPDSRGTIQLFSERVVCESCGGVVDQFRKMFPNIEVVVTSGVVP